MRLVNYQKIFVLIGLFLLTSCASEVAVVQEFAPTSEEVFEYKTKAAQGDRDAQFQLGKCYYFGKGVPHNGEQAIKWYRKSAEQGNDKALNNIGVCYERGIGVPKDEIEAYAYYNLASATNERARTNLALLEYYMSSEVRMLGQQRTKQLKKEIEGRVETPEDLRNAIEKEKQSKGA